MSYISAMLSKNYKNVLVWERDSDGNRIIKKYDAPYYFYIPDGDGEHSDIFGNKLMKLEFSEYSKFKETCDRFKASGMKIYESDIRPEHKVLSENYYGKDITNLHTTFLDIEADYDKAVGFPSVDNPYAPISSVAIYHKYNNRMVLYVVPSEGYKELKYGEIPEDIRKLAHVTICKNEKILLKCLLSEIENSDIISGWNSEFFDIPYIYQRLLLILGQDEANNLSFKEARPPRIKETMKFDNAQKTLELYGRVSLDYLELFKRFIGENKPSYALDSIAEEYLPDLPKLEYEGSLYDLYRDDLFMFMRYNIRDTEILKGFEEKFRYVDLSILMSHMATGPIEQVLGTIKLSELAIINYCHYDMNTIVPDSNDDSANDNGEKFGGAFVLPPQIGMHDWVSALDVASLYPSSIRTVNISPETLVGQFSETNKAYEYIVAESDKSLFFVYDNGVTDEKSAKEWRKELKDNEYSISGYGTVFSQKREGFIPAILTKWFAERKEYKSKMNSAKAILKEYENRKRFSDEEKATLSKAKHESEYYDRMQYIKKIQLNSLYGCMGNPYFKFYDIRMAESTTKTGREILMHMVKKTSELIDGAYSFPSESIVYGDTDSVYFKTNCDNVEDALKVSQLVLNKINKSFIDFTREVFLCKPGFDELIKAEHEIISKKAIFVKKKLYILHLVYKEGDFVDKMKVMGLQIKKTIIPKAVSKRLIKILEDFLKGKPWNAICVDVVNYKDELLSSINILDIGLPKGIQGVEDYTEKFNLASRAEDVRLPGHVAAAMFWNKCVESYKDVNSPKITSGFKIKTFYLKKKFGHFKSIAVPTDTRELPEWFVENFVPIVDRDAQILRLVDKPLENIFKAIGERPPTKKTILINDVVEY